MYFDWNDCFSHFFLLEKKQDELFTDKLISYKSGKQKAQTLVGEQKEATLKIKSEYLIL